jgi:DNA-directed RNA polymerase
VDNDTKSATIGAKLCEILVELNLIELKVITHILTKNKINIYTPTEAVLNMIGEKKFVTLPLKLPMIVKPKEYTPTKLGGYLLNDEEYTDNIFIDKFNNREKTVSIDSNIYEIINNISSIGYKINKDVLKFVINNGAEFGLISNGEHHLRELDKEKLSKLERKQLDSFVSKYELEQNILGMASVYRNIHRFYIPVRMDNRGRVYCMSSYLNYQSIDLAKALLLFSNGESICKTDTVAIE